MSQQYCLQLVATKNNFVKELNCFFFLVIPSPMQSSICCGSEHSNWRHNSCGSYARQNGRFGNAVWSVSSELSQEREVLALEFKAQVLNS
jgi:hypothetical protein